MAGEHYFSAAPGGADRRRPLTVTLAGRERQLSTAGGVFSPDRMDAGTAVLLATAPCPPPTGNLLDIGCGWGPIALTLALAAPGATVWAVDVNTRALELTAGNAAAVGAANLRAVTPEEVPDSIRFEAIWSNPPIRVGKPELHRLLLSWLPRLTPGGNAWLVVQRNLGSDSLQRWLADTLPGGFGTDRAALNRGYRVLRVHRSG